MKTKKVDTRYLVMLAMFVALMLVLQITGIGLIKLPIINATTMHIPVILCAILMGPKAGGILGAVFGLCSIWTNTAEPTGVLAFALSPINAAQICGFGGAVASVWIALGCRILLGVAAGWLWILLKKWKVNDFLALPVAAGISTIFHSLIVMSSIALLLAPQAAQSFSEDRGYTVAVEAVMGLCMGIVASSGIPETIAAILLVTAIGKAAIAFLAHTQKRRK